MKANYKKKIQINGKPTEMSCMRFYVCWQGKFTSEHKVPKNGI